MYPKYFLIYSMLWTPKNGELIYQLSLNMIMLEFVALMSGLWRLSQKRYDDRLLRDLSEIAVDLFQIV